MAEQIICQNGEVWSEDICLRCGLCCLCKLNTTDGIFLTNVCCDSLNTATQTCRDYENRHCPKLDNYKVLYEGYRMPACCVYVKKHLYQNNMRPPVVNWNNVITESEMENRGECLGEHLIPTSWKQFKYLEKLTRKH